MLLVVDAGNTNIVFAVHDGEGWRGQWRVATNPERTADEYAVWLHTLLGHAGLRFQDVDGVVIGSVVPAANFNLMRLSRAWFHCDPLLVRAAGFDWGFEVRIDNPQEVGADRLLNAIAAHAHWKGPLIAIDFGTATTFDVVDGEGHYLGGVIAPGINLSLEALHRAAAALPRIAVQRPQAVIGRSTVPAMQSGIYWGYVGLIEGITRRIAAEFGQPMKVIATGGLAPLFAGGTTEIHHVDPELTLRGLLLFAARNPPPRPKR
ncbi:MAG: type III pantothenate kinase [Alphaproteobacteria bacterium]|nr:type III pantothenate kinase [Alphaproteobacteria bacterium]